MATNYVACWHSHFNYTTSIRAIIIAHFCYTTYTFHIQ